MATPSEFDAKFLPQILDLLKQGKNPQEIGDELRAKVQAFRLVRRPVADIAAKTELPPEIVEEEEARFRQKTGRIDPEPPGQLIPGNIDVSKQPAVQNPDGSISTVRSMSFQVDGKEVLVPTVSLDGRIISNQEAIDKFFKDGKHLGVFDTPESATRFAQELSANESRRASQFFKRTPLLTQFSQDAAVQSLEKAKQPFQGPIIISRSKGMVETILDFATGVDRRFLSDTEKRQQEFEAANRLALEIINLIGAGKLARAVSPEVIERTLQQIVTQPTIRNLILRNRLAGKIFSFLGAGGADRAIRGVALSVPFAVTAGGRAAQEGESPTKAALEVTTGFLVFEGLLAGAGMVIRPFKKRIIDAVRREAQARVQAALETLEKEAAGKPLNAEGRAAVAETVGAVVGDTVRRTGDKEFVDIFRDELAARLDQMFTAQAKQGGNTPHLSQFMRGMTNGVGDEPLEAIVDTAVGHISRKTVKGAVPKIPKGDRRRLLKESAARVKEKSTSQFPKGSVAAAEDKIVSASKPELVPLSDVFNDTGFVVPRRPSFAPPAPPKPAAVDSLEAVRAEAGKRGLRIKVEEMAASGEAPGGVKAQPRWRYVIEDSQGRYQGEATSLKDLLTTTKNRVGTKPLSLLAGEVANQTALADDPEDTVEERNLKVALRTAVRTVSIAAMIPGVKGPGRGAAEWEAAAQRAAGGIKGFFTRTFIDSGRAARAKKEWDSIRTAFTKLYAGARTVDELIRNMPAETKVPVQRFFASYRGLNREWADIRRFLFTDLERINAGEGSIASEQTGAILDQVDSALLRMISMKGDPAEIRARLLSALNVSVRRKTKTSVDEESVELARDAIRLIEPENFGPLQKYANIYSDTRRRVIEKFKERFPTDVGNDSPFVVVKSDGRSFQSRFGTRDEAEKFIERLRVGKNKETGFETIVDVNPLPEEIMRRVGPTQSAYLPRLLYDNLVDRYGVDDIIAAAPWADPAHILNELSAVVSANVSRAERSGIIRELFGEELTNAQVSQLIKAGTAAVRETTKGGERRIITGIPQQLYVKFYKKRIGKDLGYSRDAVRALAAYTGPVLRDIHLGPHLGPIGTAIEAARVRGTNPAVLDVIMDNLSFILGRESQFNRELGTFTAKSTGLAYGATLWARTNPAFNNLIGQIFTVGIPESGFDSSIAAFVAMTDPAVLRAVANMAPIRNSLPINQQRLVSVLANIRNAASPKEAVGLMKEAGVSSFDFLGLTEVYVRTMGFLAEMSNALKRRGLLTGPIPGDILAGRGVSGSTAVGRLNGFVKRLDQLPQAERDAILLEAEDGIRKWAFWFDPGSQPLYLRKIKQMPFGGFATMFLNFPTNYANRFMSVAADAFNSGLSTQERAAAQGRIIRHLSMVALIGGPMALPIINETINEVSDRDPGVGGRLRKFLTPYQNYWADTMRKMGAGALASIDNERFSSLQPIEDAFNVFNPRRFAFQPLPRLIGTTGMAAFEAPRAAAETSNRLFGTNIPISPAVNEWSRKAAQDSLGFLSPFFEVAEPEGFQFPEAFTTLVQGGGAMQDWANYLYARRASAVGLAGPLDDEHRRKGVQNPAIDAFLGRTEAENVERNRVRFIEDTKKGNRLIVRDLLNAALNPTVSKREKERAFDKIRARPDLIDNIADNPEMITKFIEGMTMRPEERAIRRADADTLRIIVSSLREDILGLDNMTLEEKIKTIKAFALATEKLDKAK